jgi:endonuclease YncB( thermonuclease family)
MPHATHSGKRGNAARFPFNGMAGMCEDGLMQIMSMWLLPSPARSALLACATLLACEPSLAGGCNFETQGEGRVVAIVDARTLRLDDGRDVKLAGIEVLDRAKAAAALSTLLVGRDVTLRGADDTPDRYGRQPAYAFLSGTDAPVQGELLRQGLALVSAEIADRSCATALMAAEAEAREARSGTWAEPSVIKNAESPGDILARIGRFSVVEGKVLSVRQAGATTYLNFGRNWTQDFAATISRRIVPAFEAAGLAPKSLENRRIRVRGWVEARRGPRIELLRVGQIEVLGGN